MRWPRCERVAVAVLAAVVAGGGCSAISDVIDPKAKADGAVVKAIPLELAFGDAPPADGAATKPALLVIPGDDPLPRAGVGAPISDLDVFDIEDVFAPPPRRDGPAVAPPDECPEPGPGAVAERPITGDVAAPVQAGSYTYRQSGSIEYVGLARFAPPRVGRRTVRNVRTAGGVTTYEVEAVIGRRREVQELRVVPGDGVFLTAIRTAVDGQERRFAPALPVEILPLPVVEQTPVNGAGADPTSGEAVVVQGTVVRKERVLGCGEVVDGWLVEATWTFRRGNEVRPFDYDYVVAPQHGGLVVADHLVATETYGNLVVRLDVRAALGTIHPRPAP